MTAAQTMIILHEAGYNPKEVWEKWDWFQIKEVILSDDAVIDKDTGRPRFIARMKAIRDQQMRKVVHEARRDRYLKAGVPEDQIDAFIEMKKAKLQALYREAGVRRMVE